MKIGALSKATSNNIETIRYYERIGLLPQAVRTSANYRSYSDAHRERLAFVRHARELGFTIEDIRSLLDLSDHPDRDCAEADHIATRHLVQVEAKIAQLQALRDEFTRILGRRRLPRDRSVEKSCTLPRAAHANTKRYCHQTDMN
jgi:DNA-binding transcriptional MerR regulator